MRKIFRPLAVAMCATLLFTACKKDVDEQKAPSTLPSGSGVSEEVLSKIKSLGFGTSTVQKVEEGYLVEGDIVLTNEHLNSKPDAKFLRVGEEEQYRTWNLVNYLPRTIYVSVSTSMPNYWSYVAATNEAINRYNALGLRLKFARVTYGGHIVISPAPYGATYLASAGFPSYSNPYSSVKVNTSALATWPVTTSIATIIAHEIGHCIGMRHTDFMNRSYSCGGWAVNEGAAGVGAVHIPYTPTGPNTGSWMLACIGKGVNRPFTYYDRVALHYLY